MNVTRSGKEMPEKAIQGAVIPFVMAVRGLLLGIVCTVLKMQK